MVLLWQQRGIPLMSFSSVSHQVHTGENYNGIEIKLDRRFRETGNLFIEYEERSGPTSSWHPSGPLKDDNSWAMAIGDYEGVFVIPMKYLKFAYKSGRTTRAATDTARGYLLPVNDAELWSLFVLTPINAVTTTTGVKEMDGL